MALTRRPTHRFSKGNWPSYRSVWLWRRFTRNEWPFSKKRAGCSGGGFVFLCVIALLLIYLF